MSELAVLTEVFHPSHAGTWDALTQTIEARLYVLGFNGNGYLVLNVDRADDIFVQFAVRPDGLLRAEAAATVASAARRGRRRLVDAHTWLRILRLGWERPTADPLRLARPGDRPNFWVDGDPADADLARTLADLTLRTLRDGFGVEQPFDVRIRGGIMAPGQLPDRC